MPSWFNVVKKGSVGEVSIYGTITNEKWYDDDVTPSDFKRALDDLGDVELLDIYLNSPGGSVFAGVTIGNIIKRHSALSRITVDGLAASIASVILQGADERAMYSNAQVMIHNVSTLVIGFYVAEELRGIAGDLDAVGESVIQSYVGRAKIEREEIQKLMDAETWMPAEDAVRLGFADYVVDDKTVDAEAVVGTGVATVNGVFMNMSKFQNFKPEQWNTAPAAPVAPVAPEPVAPVAPEPVDYSYYENQISANATALYISENS